MMVSTGNARVHDLRGKAGHIVHGHKVLGGGGIGHDAKLPLSVQAGHPIEKPHEVVQAVEVHDAALLRVSDDNAGPEQECRKAGPPGPVADQQFRPALRRFIGIIEFLPDVDLALQHPSRSPPGDVGGAEVAEGNAQRLGQPEHVRRPLDVHPLVELRELLAELQGPRTVDDAGYAPARAGSRRNHVAVTEIAMHHVHAVRVVAGAHNTQSLQDPGSCRGWRIRPGQGDDRPAALQ